MNVAAIAPARPAPGSSPEGQVDLDAAATTPPLPVVVSAVEQLMPLYGSVHRGSGWKSRITSAAYEGARAAVRDFAGADAHHDVIFVRGTTEAANLLSACLPAGSVVLAGAHEHHANLLPWTRHLLRLVPLTRSPAELLDAFEEGLRRHRGRVRLVAVTGASNVTGEVFPLAELAALAHEHGAQIFVDAAQLAPHRALDMASWDVDHLAFSGHKLYAPFGAGVLVARSDLVRKAPPWLRGGGASRNVTRHHVEWTPDASRHEAGSPNVVGAVAVGVACDALRRMGPDTVAEHERPLLDALYAGLDELPGVTRHVLWEGADDRVPLATFTVRGWRPSALADALASRGIGVRAGRFCAHMLIDALTGTKDGAVRASLGLHTTADDAAVLIDALADILLNEGSHRHTVQPPLPGGFVFRLA